MPLLQPIRSNREDTVATALQAMSPASRISASGGAALDRERITALATGAHLLIGCFDKGFSSTHHWINQVSLSLKVPAVFAECAGHIGRVGPLVLPAQTACYMTANKDDFAFHMQVSLQLSDSNPGPRRPQRLSSPVRTRLPCPRRAPVHRRKTGYH